MSTFVLVHGAFRGGWAWDRVQPLLVAEGHDVHAPDLLGDATGLDVWVDQLAGVLEDADLTDVLLVGHSMGSVVTTATAARVAERLLCLAHIDGGVPAPGERAVDLGPGGFELPPRDTVIPARPMTAGGDLDEATAEWMNARLTPTPFAPSLDPVPAVPADLPVHFAFCTQTPDGYPSGTTRARLDAAGTPYALLDAGHDAPVTAPELVADWLLTLT